MLMSVRDMDVLRLLCWCQNVRPDDLSSISTETERENLITLGLIKRHQRSDTLLLTNSGRAFLQAALEGDVPNLTLSYHDAAIERRVRLSSLMMTAYSCAPFITEDESEVRGSRTSDLEGLADGEPSAACQEPQNLLSKNREDRASRTAKSAFPEPQKLPPSKKEKRKIDQSHMEVRQSVRAPAQDGRTDGDAEEELLDILDSCELECFAPETALVFENAIERLFYADSFRIGNATLPQSRVRAKLRRLDGMILREAESKLRANQERNVKNSTAYTMAVLFNCIAESESDLMIDPYLNTICAAV